MYGYALPDGGHLGRHLTTAGLQQFGEYDQFVGRLHEAVGAWQEWAERAALIVLREVVGGLVTDEELKASLSLVPDWLSERRGAALQELSSTKGHQVRVGLLRADSTYLFLCCSWTAPTPVPPGRPTGRQWA